MHVPFVLGLVTLGVLSSGVASGQQLYDALADTPLSARALCDQLAASPSDPDKPKNVPGVEAAAINVADALPACEAALATEPRSARYLFQYGRVLSAAKRDREAVALYSRAADLNYIPAIHNLGFAYFSGNGVVQDDRRALTLFARAADAGFVRSIRTVGWMYSQGRGTVQSDALALDWYRKGAQLNDTESIRALGLFYAEGRGGLKQDHQAAFTMFSHAAMNGSEWGTFNVANAYARGLGVRKDVAGATRLFKKLFDSRDTEVAKAAIQETYRLDREEEDEKARRGIPTRPPRGQYGYDEEPFMSDGTALVLGGALALALIAILMPGDESARDNTSDNWDRQNRELEKLKKENSQRMNCYLRGGTWNLGYGVCMK